MTSKEDDDINAPVTPSPGGLLDITSTHIWRRQTFAPLLRSKQSFKTLYLDHRYHQHHVSLELSPGPLLSRTRPSPLPLHVSHSRKLTHHHCNLPLGNNSQSQQDPIPRNRHSHRRKGEKTMAEKGRKEKIARIGQRGIRAGCKERVDQ